MAELRGPVRFVRETTDPELGHEWLRQGYQDHLPRLSGDRADFRMRMASVGVEEFRLDEIRHTMTLDAQVDPYDAVLMVQPRSGRFWCRGMRGEIDQGPTGLLLLDPSQGLRAGWPSGIDELVVRLETEPVRQLAEELTDIPAEKVWFEHSTPVGTPQLRHGLAVIKHVREVAAHDEILDSSLVRAELFRMLTVAVLATFPNNAMNEFADRPAPGTLRYEPAVLRRAVEFVDANAQHPIGLRQIAEAARISSRGLQHAFRKHRSCTPLQYLKLVRLQHAHRELQAADPTCGETVAAIASRWGFSHPGRFSAEYYAVYGRLPSRTLRT